MEVVGRFTFHLEKILPLGINSYPKFLIPHSALSLIDNNVLYSVNPKKLTAYSLQNPELKFYRGGFGISAIQAKVPKLWVHENKNLLRTIIKSGSKIYVGTDRDIFAVKSASDFNENHVTWSVKTSAPVVELAAASQKLFATTLEGSVYCYGNKSSTSIIYPHDKKVIACKD